MSLIHWWPLNGDLQDKIQGKVLSTSTWTSSTEGKIGSCYNMNIGGTATCSNIYLPSTFTMTCWIKNNDLTYPQSPCAMKLSNGSPYKTTAADKGWEFCHGGTLSFTTNDGTAPKAKFLNYNPSSLIGTWYHLALVSDFINKVAYIYINGSLVKSATITSGDWGGTYTFTVGELYGWKIDGLMNDLRLYDHALSQAEVKELSKALVVHYTFDDILAEPTTNVSTINGWNSYTPYFVISERTKTGLKVYRPSSSTSNVLALNNSAVTGNMTAGDIWTFSCFLYIDGKPYKCTQSDMSTYNYSGISYYSNDDGYYTCTFRVGSPETWVIHASMFGAVGTDIMCEIDKIQFEKKDHATPYTPTSRESMLVNEAGYGGNGTLYNSSLSTDTASGTWSCHTPRINPNNVDTMVSPTNSAYVYADVFGYNHTPTEFTVAWWWKVIDWGYGTGPFGLVTSNGNYMDSTLGVHDGAVYVNFTGGNTRVSRGFTGGGTGKWTHFAITFKPGSYTSYINGVSQGTASTNASLTLDPWRYVYLGAGCAGGCLRDGDIYWGDFRYYNTCLSANDILELYKTKAYITNQGDVETHQFIENCKITQITNTYNAEARDIQEIGNEEYEQLEYIASTGTQYIDTGVYWTSEKATIVADLMVTAWKASSTIFGSEEGYTSPYSSSKRYFAHILHAGSANGSYATYTGTGSMGTTTLTKDTRSVIEYITHGNNKVTTKVTVNGTTTTCVNNQVYSGTILTHQNSKQTAANRGHIYIFSNHNAASGTAGIQNMSAMRLYRFTMIQDDIYLRDFIPCRRKSDSKVGLFDLVTGQFYTSPTGNFTAGNVVTNEDITAKFLSGGSIQARQFIEI